MHSPRPSLPAGTVTVKYERKAVRPVPCYGCGKVCSDVFVCLNHGAIAPACNEFCACDYFGSYNRTVQELELAEATDMARAEPGIPMSEPGLNGFSTGVGTGLFVPEQQSK